eukprot:Hpha_TRINITY_DN9014_c0_g1::TRINITY_DN9014_c0_g1_i1::g.141771::m.141771
MNDSGVEEDLNGSAGSEDEWATVSDVGAALPGLAAGGVAQSFTATPQEVLEYALYLGIDPVREADLIWVAERGVNAGLPDGWQACQEEPSGRVYYWHATTGGTSWEHPSDAEIRQVLADARSQKPPASRALSRSTVRSSPRRQSQAVRCTRLTVLNGVKSEGLQPLLQLRVSSETTFRQVLDELCQSFEDDAEWSIADEEDFQYPLGDRVQSHFQDTQKAIVYARCHS